MRGLASSASMRSMRPLGVVKRLRDAWENRSMPRGQGRKASEEGLAEGRGHTAKQDELDELGLHSPVGSAALHQCCSEVGGQPAGPAPAAQCAFNALSPPTCSRCSASSVHSHSASGPSPSSCSKQGREPCPLQIRHLVA